MKEYYVYILTNNSMSLYIGVTNNLERRMNEHLSANDESFTGQYKINKLIYFEATSSIDEALAREKQIKKWSRAKKLDLIKSMNPKFVDLQIDFSTSSK